ncbi:MAG: hypothetical protein ACI9T7_003233, partial [Oleiphilaceae bacterium]
AIEIEIEISWQHHYQLIHNKQVYFLIPKILIALTMSPPLKFQKHESGFLFLKNNSKHFGIISFI